MTRDYFSPIFIFFIFVVNVVSATGPDSKTINFTGNEVVPIGKYSSLLIDNDELLGIENILENAHFKAIKSDYTNLGFVKGAVWFKFEVKNLSEETKLKLEIDYPFLDELELYSLDKNNNIEKSKIHEFVELSQRSIPYFGYVFDLNVLPGKVKTFYLKIKNKEPLTIPAKILTPSQLYKSHRIKYLIIGSLIGILGAMCIYNLFLFFFIRDKSYLYYVLCILSIGLDFLAMEGSLFLIPGAENVWFRENFPYIICNLGCIIFLIFMDSFLKMSVRIPIWKTMKIPVFILFLSLMIISFFADKRLSFILSANATGVYLMVLLLTSIFLYKQGYREARFIVVGWSFLTIFITHYILIDKGIFPYTEFSKFEIPIGAAIETIFFSIALADKINILKRDKAISQQKEIKALKEKEALAQQFNLRLENKVEERTKKLKLLNSELEQTYLNLKEAKSRMTTLGQNVAGIAHSINNPLNVLSCSIIPLKNILQKNKIKEPVITQLVNNMQGNINSLGEMAEVLNEFSSLGLEEKTCLKKAVKSARLLLKHKFGKGIELKTEFGPSEILINVNRGSLIHLLMDILNNATEAVDKKNGIIEIETKVTKEIICVKISNNGSPINIDQEKYIFDPFFSTKNEAINNGLGLANAKQIMVNYGGTIEVTRNLKNWTCFVLSFPINKEVKANTKLPLLV